MANVCFVLLEQTPKGKGEKTPKTPGTPKVNLTIPEIKAKIMEAMKKVGVKKKKKYLFKID